MYLTSFLYYSSVLLQTSNKYQSFQPNRLLNLLPPNSTSYGQVHSCFLPASQSRNSTVHIMAQKTVISKNLDVGVLSIRLTDNVLRHPHMTSRINLFRSQQARNSSSNAQQAGPKKLISPHVSHSLCFISQPVIDQLRSFH